MLQYPKGRTRRDLKRLTDLLEAAWSLAKQRKHLELVRGEHRDAAVEGEENVPQRAIVAPRSANLYFGIVASHYGR